MTPVRPLAVMGAAGALALAATPPTQAQDDATQTVFITASPAQRAFDLPYAVGIVDGAALRAAGPMVNLSEALARVPGLVVNLRQNYAQDLQISSRGFGARTGFGVRGIRLLADGIPATGPDGQGQVSHFDLAGAERVEVLRGPYSALYGSNSGGVIALVSAAPRERAAWLDADAGADGLRQWRAGVEAPLAGGWNVRAAVSRFETDGPRAHAAAQRTLAHLRLGWEGEHDRVVLRLDTIEQPAQDPLGLTRAQLDADPGQTAPQALQFDTRKDTSQTQAGMQWQHRGTGALQRTVVAAYVGRRSVTQWQAIPVATQTPPSQPGGVIDFDRRYAGVDARLHWRGAGWRFVAGAAFDEQREDRRGYENFVNDAAGVPVLGVTGRLRRDEEDRATSRDVYAQAEVDVAATVVAAAGLRAGRLRQSAADRFLANGDDSGAVAERFRTPMAAVRWQPAPEWNVYASVARGAETPTLAERAYRADGGAGLNTALRPQSSRQWETGAKWRADGGRAAFDMAVFGARTDDEIAVATNAGGRATFRNVGRTTRRGAEIAASWQPTPAWRGQVSATWLHAVFADDFLVCAAVPCTTPTLPVPAGRRIAGTVPRSAWAEVAYTQGAAVLALEGRAVGPQPVDDANSDFAAGYGTLALRAQWQHAVGDGRLEWLLRVDNLADRRVAGSVIVSEANRRWFEPTAGRTALLSARWRRPF